MRTSPPLTSSGLIWITATRAAGCTLWVFIFPFSVGGGKCLHSYQQLRGMSRDQTFALSTQFIINKFLPGGLHLKCLAPEFLFQGLDCKSNFFKALINSSSLCSCCTACVQPWPVRWQGHLSVSTSDLAEVSPGHQSYGNSGWLICSVFIPFLSSLGVTPILVNQWSDRLCLLFFPPFQLYQHLSLCHRST